jgi:hypothetical protein
MSTILREWRGVIRKADRAIYVDYVRRESLKEVRS